MYYWRLLQKNERIVNMDLFNKGVEDANVADLRNSDTGNPESSGEELQTNGDSDAEVAELQNDGEKADVNAAPEVAVPGEMSDDDFESYISNILSDRQDAVESVEAADTADEATTPDNSKDDVKKPQNEPFKTFNSQNEYQAEIDRIISKRIKDYRGAVAEHDNLVNQLKEFYDVDEPEEAIKLFKNQLKAQKVAESGMSEEDYDKDQVNKQKIKAYDALIAEKQQRNNLRGRLYAEAGRIRENDSTFDLQSVYNSDAEFKRDLEQSGSVFFAYSQLVQRAAKKTSAAPAEKNKRTFSEEGATPARKGQVSTSAANMTDEDFEAYIKNILEG